MWCIPINVFPLNQNNVITTHAYDLSSFSKQRYKYYRIYFSFRFIKQIYLKQ